MRAHWKRNLLLILTLGAVGACERWCPEEISQVRPRMLVEPEAIDGVGGISQDTFFTITISNPSNTELEFVENGIRLDEMGDPNFRIVQLPDSVLPSASAEVVVAVRPVVTGTITTTLQIEAEPDALPNYAEVPFQIDAVDLGLPDIEVDPTELDFARIGENDVARAPITVQNNGVRDLIIDETVFVPAEEGDNSIRLITPVQPGWALAPAESLTLDMVFAPTDTVLHSGELVIRSNDPDEAEIRIPVQGRGSLCPVAVAEVLDDAEDIEPLDTIRITGENSYAQSDGTDIESYDWVLEQRPIGSTAIIDEIAAERVQLTCDLAGDYVVRLTAVDTDGIRSCNDSVVRLHVEPSQDLHIQLVWDHPTADLDLHLLRENGYIFTHDGDVYFSNREPEWFSGDEQSSNPTLDADDNRGYGPENINIESPLPGSRWKVLVHYWNRQTDGDAFTIATLRIYAFGQVVADIPQTFDTDQSLWNAVEIVWPQSEGEAPEINPIGLVEPFFRPF